MLIGRTDAEGGSRRRGTPVAADPAAVSNCYRSRWGWVKKRGHRARLCPFGHGGHTAEILTFEIAGRRFGLTARLVQEVTRAPAIAALPKAPPIVEGVINVRGALVPVLDIRERFGIPPRALTPDQHLIIARTNPRLVALRVDRALDLVVVDEDAVESAASVAPGAEYVAGIAKLTDGLLVIHDLETFLSLDEARQVDAAVVGATAPGEPPSQRKGKR